VSNPDASADVDFMRRALALAARGQGHVEPNPMVGCVVAQAAAVVGEGWHRKFGGPHAEVEALSAAGEAARGATLYVTLEPCCHHGKTPPCTAAILESGIRRVVVAHRDPFPLVSGDGLRQLRDHGLQVETGLLQHDAATLNAPYLKLVHRTRPWVIGKWAMTLDGKLATRTGCSRWISNPASREAAHRLRGRVDAIVVGRRTVELDDPMLTARPAGPRTAVRVVLDSLGTLSSQSQLARTARDIPLLVAVGPDADVQQLRRLESLGAEVYVSPPGSRVDRWKHLLDELGRRRMTNLLVEGGGTLLGSARDAQELDEVHVVLAATIVGGRAAVTPCEGQGAASLHEAMRIDSPNVEWLQGDLHIWGRLTAGRLDAT
jgi:diaminohydroxyphosphoribosylaminopyrimidine deaminase/5-amino-6-(5-phosphoribosylamino)uracil reductase